MQFLSVDPDVAQTMEPYAFVGDNPLNETDPLGLHGRWYNPCNWWSFCHHVRKVAKAVAHNNVEHLIMDLPQDPIYLQYWGSYEAIGKLNAVGNHLGVVGKVVSHVVTAPLVPLEASGLAGDTLLNAAKGEPIYQEDRQNQPLLRNEHLGPVSGAAISRDLGLPEMQFPGLNYANKHIDFNW